MSEPLTEQIAQALQAVVKTVTTGNGYSFTVLDCVRPTKMGGYALDDKLVTMDQDNWRPADPNTKYNGSTGAVRRVLPFGLNLFLNPSETDTAALDTYINRSTADMEKALVVDRTLGGIAIYLELAEPEFLLNKEGAFAGVRINVEVTYSHRANDPYTAA